RLCDRDYRHSQIYQTRACIRGMRYFGTTIFIWRPGYVRSGFRNIYILAGISKFVDVARNLALGTRWCWAVYESRVFFAYYGDCRRGNHSFGIWSFGRPFYPSSGILDSDTLLFVYSLLRSEWA